MTDKNTEKAFPRKATTDKDGEHSYLFTECGNIWYSVTKNPMYRNNCICPKCGKTVLVKMTSVN